MTEALAAACLLLKLASTDGVAEGQFSALWPHVLDMDKQLFLNDKFLAVASDSGWYEKSPRFLREEIYVVLT